ncbi:CDP-glycerol glycerophosphotransferase family protein [Lactiplantibacillus mudanjiangensis]|uniref:CDP-glycerol--poly(Glycerophosphate) glycerophosphotransferase [Lactobacillus sp.] n=1 Tax=Lactiplantibacillus mudanjiangensis TaxID=1296538 RepID=A0A660DXV5_9LACO|nr:CDP-glycerol glycerophosphotransferase family protein [Lactiplantibacillus mudanjiangensis]VDG25002.1 CDP-glycerol--poly(glycerophosphate) glycerophosphotransferase [Lactobacillus sp.] [Lactiplantibacillus mudanjiangensis]VDG27992.1 CDP-glycerol--poly(glycerophosphate) glycerophosphotransferase [Lactobacillus sp.] [Lactiplantibacillus mudanjiangensis]VDG30883.1 CDP-glycerol--poly(glycerophosphate) glycerophosphotransferase [Lactobacillus sp.] [Lactiplantibacillus mudanjiangensis]
MLTRLKRRARQVVRHLRRPAPAVDSTNVIDANAVTNQLNEPHLATEADSLIKRHVTQLDFNGAYLTIRGQAWFEQFPEDDPEKIIKSLILIDEQGIEIAIPLVNAAVKVDKFPQAGYHGAINFAKLNHGKPLAPGRYEMRLQLKQYLPQGWLIRRTSIGQIGQAAKDLNYTTKMTSYAAKSNQTFSLIFEYQLAAQAFFVSSHKLSDINPLENEVADAGYELENPTLRALKRRLLKWWYRWYCLRPIKADQISFVSDSRTSISGNFEFIYQTLQQDATNFKTTFYLKPSIKAKKSFREVRQLAKALATSRYIFLDDFYPLIYPLKIRENADLIQVWHAVGAFKTFGYSRVGMPGGPKPTSLNHRNYTKVLVSSQQVVDKYAEGFGITDDKVLPLGIPRTDIFFDQAKQAEIKTRLQTELPFINGKKVILFAPTFRGNGQQSANYPFETLNFKQLYDGLHEDYVFLLKIHPFVQNKPTIPYEYTDFFYDVSDYREINDLLLIADQLITDYSSVCFEYALLKRPMVFFAPDLADYMRSRSFYFDYFDFIPGQLAENMPELLDQLKHPKIDQTKVDQFVDYFFDDLDGQASRRLVDALNDGFAASTAAAEQLDADGQLRTDDGKVIPDWGRTTKKNPPA